jgi:hypothetical protein
MPLFSIVPLYRYIQVVLVLEAGWLWFHDTEYCAGVRNHFQYPSNPLRRRRPYQRTSRLPLRRLSNTIHSELSVRVDDDTAHLTILA